MRYGYLSGARSRAVAEWDTAYINALPDSAFACIDGGGTKEDGKTVPRSLRHYPHHNASGALDLPHLRNALSRVAQEATTSCGVAHLRSHARGEGVGEEKSATPAPREGYRALFPALEVRDAAGEAPRLVGHFAVFNEWTRIESDFEGTFMERIVPGAFKKTFDEGRARMKVLFNHGKDPTLGNQILGQIEQLREDEKGAYYEVALHEGIPPLLMSGLRGGQYGSSFRFKVMREDFLARPKASAYNPDALPERSLLEAYVPEFGPVTYPAYVGATAGIRSITDELMAAPSTPGAAVKAITPHPGQERRVQVAVPRFRNREEYLAWIRKI
jgi:HK97 family phage prohead protease